MIAQAYSCGICHHHDCACPAVEAVTQYGNVQEWEDPPPWPRRTPTYHDIIVAQMAGSPGVWMLVDRHARSKNTGPWKRRGCEVTTRKVRRAEVRGFDIYARWPDTSPPH